jgi:phage terminase large subunit
MNSNNCDVWLPDIVGEHYAEFWRWKGRYRVVKGSRSSKKSVTMALWAIYSIMKYPGANLLVIRKTYRTIKDSCYAQLKWAIHRLGVDALFLCKESPLEITYTPTGQKIFFRGLDDPLKVTSITVETGVLCWMWIEEAYEITREADFETLDESIRGSLPAGLFKSVTLTFNPWNDRHWLKARFFDKKDPEVLALTTNYLMNEFLDGSDRKIFERMKVDNPRRYKVAGLGEWGVIEGLVYERWQEQAFSWQEVSAMDGVESAFGLDFGYTNDPTALWCGLISNEQKTIWVFDELYAKALTNEMIAERLTSMGYAKELITADSAEPKSIEELRRLGIRRIRGAAKGKDSIINGIQKIQDYMIIIHPRCVNFLTEISCYSWDKDKFDKPINRPIDDNNHLMDAMRYALENKIHKPSGLKFNSANLQKYKTFTV